MPLSVLELLGALASPDQAVTPGQASTGVPSLSFTDVLQAALKGDGDGDGVVAQFLAGLFPGAEGGLPSRLRAGDELPAALMDELPDELTERLAQLDALAGLYLLALAGQTAPEEGNVQVGAEGEPAKADGVPRSVARALQALVATGAELPPALQTLAGVAGAKPLPTEGKELPIRAVPILLTGEAAGPPPESGLDRLRRMPAYRWAPPTADEGVVEGTQGAATHLRVAKADEPQGEAPPVPPVEDPPLAPGHMARPPSLTLLDRAARAMLADLVLMVQGLRPEAVELPPGDWPPGVLPEHVVVEQVADFLAEAAATDRAGDPAMAETVRRWVASLREQYAEGRIATIPTPSRAPEPPQLPSQARAPAAPPPASMGQGREPPVVPAAQPTAVAPLGVTEATAVDQGTPSGVAPRADGFLAAAAASPHWRQAVATGGGTREITEIPSVIRVGGAEFVTRTPLPSTPASESADQLARLVRQLGTTGAVPPEAPAEAANAPALRWRPAQTAADGSLAGHTEPSVSALSSLMEPTSVGTAEDLGEPPRTWHGVDRRDMMEQLAAAVAQMRLTRRGGQITVRLKPEHLGEMRVAVSISDGVVRARILTQSPAVRAALEGDMSQLRQTLAESGLQVDSLQVSVSSENPNRYTPQKDQAYYGHQYQSFEPGGRGAGGLDPLAAEPILGRAMAAATTSTLSVLA